jgi:hypothetical protein
MQTVLTKWFRVEGETNSKENEVEYLFELENIRREAAAAALKAAEEARKREERRQRMLERAEKAKEAKRRAVAEQEAREARNQKLLEGTEVWTGTGVFLGNIDVVANYHWLLEQQIRVVVNVTRGGYSFWEENDEAAPHSVMQVPVDDSPEANLLQYFDSAAAFIETARQKGERVLVHCRHGQSRSPALLLAWSLKGLGLSLAEAYDHIVAHYPNNLLINTGFKAQLMEYERLISSDGTNSIDLLVAGKRERRQAQHYIPSFTPRAPVAAPTRPERAPTNGMGSRGRKRWTVASSYRQRLDNFFQCVPLLSLPTSRDPDSLTSASAPTQAAAASSSTATHPSELFSPVLSPRPRRRSVSPSPRSRPWISRTASFSANYDDENDIEPFYRSQSAPASPRMRHFSEDSDAHRSHRITFYDESDDNAEVEAFVDSFSLSMPCSPFVGLDWSLSSSSSTTTSLLQETAQQQEAQEEATAEEEVGEGAAAADDDTGPTLALLDDAETNHMVGLLGPSVNLTAYADSCARQTAAFQQELAEQLRAIQAEVSDMLRTDSEVPPSHEASLADDISHEAPECTLPSSSLSPLPTPAASTATPPVVADPAVVASPSTRKRDVPAGGATTPAKRPRGSGSANSHDQKLSSRPISAYFQPL